MLEYHNIPHSHNGPVLVSKIRQINFEDTLQIIPSETFDLSEEGELQALFDLDLDEILDSSPDPKEVSDPQINNHENVKQELAVNIAERGFSFEPVTSVNREPALPAPKIDVTKAYAAFQKYSTQLEKAAAAMSDHKRWCTGTDGHTFSKTVSTKDIETAREEAFINIMNTKFGKKLSNGEEISEEEIGAISEIVATTYDRKLGTQTRSLVEELKRQNISFSDDTALSQMMLLMPEHMHGAGCDHGGATISPSSGTIFSGGVTMDSLTSSSFLDSLTGGHENHDKVFYCYGCKKSHQIHVHENETVKCPKCESKDVKEIKKEYSH